MRAVNFHCLILVVYILALNCSSYFRPSRVNMDKLSAEQQAAIAKSSSDRLRQTLLGAGDEEVTVSTMDRGALKEAAAKQRLQGPAEPSSLERESWL